LLNASASAPVLTLSRDEWEKFHPRLEGFFELPTGQKRRALLGCGQHD
jgi:hypothetical protein